VSGIGVIRVRSNTETARQKPTFCLVVIVLPEFNPKS
jgi:hypothetical protein